MFGVEPEVFMCQGPVTGENVIAFVLAFCLTTAIVFAADKIDAKSLEQKTLPSEIYDRLKEGKRTSLFWRDSSFAFNSSYSVEKVEWLAAGSPH